MRAIGISRRSIFIQTVMDSLVLSAAGAVIGILPGFFGAKLLDGYLRELYGVDIQFASFEVSILIASMVYLFLLVAMFSLIPAARATTIMPKSGMMRHYNR
jgi:ABC-type antimicrobial peptide transport system permease subunit